jgi:poly(3-hydroxybutyrate) depolymerase
MRVIALLAACGAAVVAGAAFVASDHAAAVDTAADDESVLLAAKGTVTVRARRTGTDTAEVSVVFGPRSRPVPGHWLWTPLTAANAVCRFDVRPGATPVVGLSLRVDRRSGCSPLIHVSALSE